MKKGLWLQLGAGVGIIGITLAIVLGVSSAAVASKPLDLDPNNPTNSISYKEATPTKSSFLSGVSFSAGNQAPWLNGKMSDNQYININDRFNYAAEIIDGSTHQVLDKSFNQSAFQGIVDWIYPKNYSTPNARYTANDFYSINQDLTQFHRDLSQAPDPTSGTQNPDNNGNTGLARKPLNDSNRGFTDVYDQLVHDGVKSLVLPGFMHATPLENWSNDSNFTNAGYIYIDGVPSESTNHQENISSLMYRADQAAYFAAIATAQYLQDNFDEYGANGLKVGTFGGLAIPTVTIYMGGFERGIYDYNQIILPALISTSENDGGLGLQKGTLEYQKALEDRYIDFISLGNVNSFFSGSFTLGDAKIVTQTLLQLGANAILPVAGPQTIDAVSEVANQRSNTIVIGVDTEQELDSSTNKKSVYTDKFGNDDIIKFSATKAISGLTSKVLYLSSKGAYGSYYDDQNNYVEVDQTNLSSQPNDWYEKDSFVGSYGFSTIGSMANDGVSVSDAGLVYVAKAASYIIDQYNQSLHFNVNDYYQDGNFNLNLIEQDYENFKQELVNLYHNPNSSKQELNLLQHIDDYMFFIY